MPENARGTFQDVLAVEPGQEGRTFVNIDFEALVGPFKEIQKKAPKTGVFWKAVLSDPEGGDGELECAFFSSKAKAYQNCVCRFSGNGMTRSEFNGSRQLGMGQHTVVEVVGKANQGARTPPDRQNSRQNGEVTPPPSQHQAPPPKNAPAFDAIGLSIELAVDMVREIDPAAPQDPVAFTQAVYVQASDLLRVFQRLAAGNLASSPIERANPTPAPAKKVDGGFQGKSEDPIEEDVPF